MTLCDQIVTESLTLVLQIPEPWVLLELLLLWDGQISRVKLALHC